MRSYFISFFRAIHYSGGDVKWVPGNKIIDIHPLEWLDGENASDTRLMWWKEIE